MQVKYIKKANFNLLTWYRKHFYFGKILFIKKYN